MTIGNTRKETTKETGSSEDTFYRMWSGKAFLGLPGCGDLEESRQTTAKLGGKHSRLSG